MLIDELRRVLIVGAGQIGRQIAISCATHGYEVTIYDVNPETLEASTAACRQALQDEINKHPTENANRQVALAGLQATLDPMVAGSDADLLIESVPEQLTLKRQVLTQFADICPPRTIFTTNTSVFMTSMFVRPSGRPEKLAALHFSMDSSLIEIMPHSRTSTETVTLLKEFSARIGHLPIVLDREQPGHLVNTMLMSLNNAALTLAANGVAAPHDIDRAWMKGVNAHIGPFGLLDLVGLKTALEISEYGAKVAGSSQVRKNVAYLRSIVEEGRLGKEAGYGFYNYPNPAFEQPEFLQPE